MEKEIKTRVLQPTAEALREAAELLKRTKQPIAEIGNSVGYDNPLHFSRAFKNALGIAPSEYRKQYHIFEEP